jgi:hypothetical protein
LKCIRFAQKEGRLTLTSADGYRLAKVTLDFEDGEGEATIEAQGAAKTAVSARYLAQTLKALGGMAEVKLSADTKAPILFSVDGYRVVVMPMFVNWGEAQEETPAEETAEQRQTGLYLEEDEDFLYLKREGETRAVFSSKGATVASIREEAEKHK